MVKTKKYKFAIFVDEHGKERLHLKKLIELLENEYPFLKQQGRYCRKGLLSKVSVKDIIVFGANKRSDFTVMSAAEYDELTEDRRFPLVNLQGQFKKVKKLLAHYAEGNYPSKFYYDHHYCCNRSSDDIFVVEDCSSSRTRVRNWWDDLVIIEDPPRRKKQSNIKIERPVSAEKRKKATGLTEVNVRHNHVQVGWDIYDIDENLNGDEYVKIKGSTYWIDRDSFGKGILSTK